MQVNAAAAGPADTARITAAQALDVYRSTGVEPGLEKDASGPPQIALVRYTNGVHQELDATGKPALAYVNRLVWMITFPGVPVIVHRPAGVPSPRATPPPCPFRIIVDATSGQYLEGWQTCDAPVSR